MTDTGKSPWESVLALLVAAGILAGAAAADSPRLIGKHATWRYLAGPARPPENWKDPSFDDHAWKSGAAGFGYGDGDDRTILADMRGHYRSVYLRAAFDGRNTRGSDTLNLYVNYDDGFVAWLNGTPVAAVAVRQEANGLQIGQHEAQGFEEFVIRDAGKLLRPGVNVLAIEGHNAELDSSDFSLDPFLTLPLNPADYLADLDELEDRLLDQSSYLTRRGFDYRPGLRQLRESIGNETRIPTFAFAIHRLLMQIGDSHAGVVLDIWPAPVGALPLRPAATDKGVVALAPGRDELLEADFPYLDSIDGRGLDEWMKAAERLVPSGSPQLIRDRSLDWLGRTSLLREELGLPASDAVRLVLRSADGTKKLERRLRLDQQSYGTAGVPFDCLTATASRSTSRFSQRWKITYRAPTRSCGAAWPCCSGLEAFRNTVTPTVDCRQTAGGNRPKSPTRGD
ncbi:MAG: hypothetical protein ACYC6Y_18410 [Thermoguttaceae bacterium]